MFTIQRFMFYAIVQSDMQTSVYFKVKSLKKNVSYPYNVYYIM